MSIHALYLMTVLAPLVGACISGFFRKKLGKVGAHRLTITLMTMSCVSAGILGYKFFITGATPVNSILYTWASGGKFFPYSFKLGYLLDSLSSMMLVIVTFVSLLVHIYSIGYMADDKGYQRFFSYISLFTFMMLMLVTSNNFLQLFFGWEGVGLVSYLLIGFWYDRESALQGSLKAFLVNRIGDFGFILGIGLILAYAGTIDYQAVFSSVDKLNKIQITLVGNHSWSLITVICILMFVGAMGKSAQVPLHVWLPESMEGPTPISALIHAATMVTAGVFMLARISPLLEYSEAALSTVLIIGSTGALFTGLIAVVMNDIKRVIAYSTLSQLGYMIAAMGASAYAAGMFHLLTHAFFKALLFLAAGSVIIGMHHEQDMRKMGGLKTRMPITYMCYLIGCLALVAFPFFSGFYSKDTIIEAVEISKLPGHKYAYLCLLTGAMVTSFYTFRSLFMTFYGKPRMDKETLSHVHESPWQVWVPLVILAIPSVIVGYLLYMPMLFNSNQLLANALYILPNHNVLLHLAAHIKSPWSLINHLWKSLPFWLTVAGFAGAFISYIIFPRLPAMIAENFSWLYKILINKYGLDDLNQKIFVDGTCKLGQAFYDKSDRKVIDGFMVEGTALTVNKFAKLLQPIQSGLLNQYLALMITGMFIFIFWMIIG